MYQMIYIYIQMIYCILGNFRGKIISLFSQICLQPQNFNYTRSTHSIIINGYYKAILKNLFVKGTHPQKFCTFPIYGIYIIYTYWYTIAIYMYMILRYTGYIFIQVIMTLNLFIIWKYASLWLINLPDVREGYRQPGVKVESWMPVNAAVVAAPMQKLWEASR